MGQRKTSRNAQRKATQKRTQNRQTPKNTENHQTPIRMSQLQAALNSPTREEKIKIAPRNRRPYLQEIRQFNRNNPKPRRTLHKETINLSKKISRRSR